MNYLYLTHLQSKKNYSLPMRGFKVILARWRCQLIRYRDRERQSITMRLQSINLKSRCSYWRSFQRIKYKNADKVEIRFRNSLGVWVVIKSTLKFRSEYLKVCTVKSDMQVYILSNDFIKIHDLK